MLWTEGTKVKKMPPRSSRVSHIGRWSHPSVVSGHLGQHLALKGRSGVERVRAKLG